MRSRGFTHVKHIKRLKPDRYAGMRPMDRAGSISGGFVAYHLLCARAPSAQQAHNLHPRGKTSGARARAGLISCIVPPGAQLRSWRGAVLAVVCAGAPHGGSVVHSTSNSVVGGSLGSWGRLGPLLIMSPSTPRQPPYPTRLPIPPNPPPITPHPPPPCSHSLLSPFSPWSHGRPGTRRPPDTGTSWACTRSRLAHLLGEHPVI